MFAAIRDASGIRGGVGGASAHEGPGAPHEGGAPAAAAGDRAAGRPRQVDARFAGRYDWACFRPGNTRSALSAFPVLVALLWVGVGP